MSYVNPKLIFDLLTNFNTENQEENFPLASFCALGVNAQMKEEIKKKQKSTVFNSQTQLLPATNERHRGHAQILKTSATLQ